jgi:hypothetical protein
MLCEQHKEILKYYCIDCNKYYCSFCINNNLFTHNENHYYFSTLNYSKTEFNEIKSLIDDYNGLKDIKYEQIFEEVIKDIKIKKDKDLSMIDKIKESINHRYNHIIDNYESLKKTLINLGMNLKNLGLKAYYDNGVFKADLLLNSIIDIKNKMNVINYKIEPFFGLNNQKNFSYSYKINDLKKILNLKKKDTLFSPVLSLFFFDFQIIIYPFGKKWKFI